MSKKKSQVVGTGNWRKRVDSESLACHPDQIPEIVERNKHHGLNIDYDSEGRPKLTSTAERRALNKIETIEAFGGREVHDRNCYS